MGAWEELLRVRELLEFPEGDNKNETVFEGVNFNLTTLRHWNYTYYSNNTVSNGSRCYLTYMPYIGPAVLEENGTWVNATKCYSAVLNIGPRGNTGIGLAAAFGIGLVLTLTALAKHGRLYIRPDRRFYPIGRRWQWYWGSFVCAAAIISLLVNIDVDRYYLQELPIIVTVFFWFLLCNGITALTWEAVRHWGSWQERQYVDPNPFIYRQDDGRSQVEFWLPLIFYFWNWLNFFLVVPRSWNFLKAQRDDRQIREIAIPTSQSPRFKAAAFCLFVAWLTICVSLWHSIKWYKNPRAGFFRKPFDYVRSVPLRLLLLLIFSLATIGYQAFISWEWEYSVMKFNGVVPVIYGWGYGPALLAIYLQVVYGFVNPNEDKELLRQRRERGETLDRELGIVHKPAWWARVRGDHLLTLRDKILRNVHEVGTERGIGRRVETDAERDARLEALGAAVNDDGFELSPLNPNNPRVDRAGARDAHLARDTSEQRPPSYRTDSQAGRYTDRRLSATPSSPDSSAQAFAERVRWLQEDGPAGNDRPQHPSSVASPPDPAAQAFADRVRWLQEDGPAPPPYRDEERGRARPDRRTSSSTTGSLSNTQPQQVRSMLDL